jgi:apolipoprotein D and lipocalin family protein
VNSTLGYGTSGLLRVQFPGQPPAECPGPNYIVQEFAQVREDAGFAIVQASNFSTLFLLSRERDPGRAAIEQWLEKAGRLGSDLSVVELVDQTGCSEA